MSFNALQSYLTKFARQQTCFSIQRTLTSSTAGRVAVITGSGRGIGRAIALRLAHDGFDIAINDLPSAEESLESVKTEITKAGRRVLVCPGDISVEGNVKQLVANATENLGSVDVMVANAGSATIGFGPISQIKVEDWDRLFSVNARGVFMCYKYAAEQMIKQGRGGRIIGASSQLGKQGMSPLATYSATKFAVRGMTQAIAQELAPHGITVNAYAPGVVETDILKDLAGENPDFFEWLRIKWSSPVGFHGKPEDIAGLVSYLASPQSRFITGQSISINGGLFFD